jgi:glutathione S-transferase
VLAEKDQKVMKLYCNPASPYVRKVMVAAIELGLDGRLELEKFGMLAPTIPNDRLSAVNPLAKIPTLVPDEGPPIFDSHVICDYFDQLHGGAKLFPAAGAPRWRALTQEAAADGLLEAAMLARMERARPATQQSPEWIAGQLGKARRGLDWFEREVQATGTPPGLAGAGAVGIGDIACGCALGWFDFRMPEENWRGGRPALAGWFGALAQRRSMKMTEPANPTV